MLVHKIVLLGRTNCIMFQYYIQIVFVYVHRSRHKLEIMQAYLKGENMDRELSMHRSYDSKRNSTQKTLRTVLLSILFHTYWPRHLSRHEIISHLSYYYGDTSIPALYRDLQTLTGIPVEELPEPDDE